MGSQSTAGGRRAARFGRYAKRADRLRRKTAGYAGSGCAGFGRSAAYTLPSTAPYIACNIRVAAVTIIPSFTANGPAPAIGMTRIIISAQAPIPNQVPLSQ